LNFTIITTENHARSLSQRKYNLMFYIDLGLKCPQLLCGKWLIGNKVDLRTVRRSS
jgi:hypothetical protein